ncbi:MAG: hypothetical protein ACYC0E_01625 [Acidimicrobiales bacterium]
MEYDVDRGWSATSCGMGDRPPRPATAQPSPLAVAERPPVYWCAGLRILVDLPLAARRVDAAPDVVVTEGPPRTIPWERPTADVIAERVVNGVPSYTFARRPNGSVARFYGLADFEIDPTNRRIVYHRDPATDPEFVAILLAGSMAAYLLSAAGRLVLHASAVEVDRAAVAFVGWSGQGKTTLATLLCAEGCRLVTDDVLPVDVTSDGVSCIPGGLELRVREKSEELAERFSAQGAERRWTVDQRRAVAPAATSAERLPLRAVAIPWPDRESDRVRARRLDPGEATFTLARYQRIEGWTAADDLRAQFLHVSALASAVPVVEVHVPWGPPFAAGLGAEVLEHVRRAAG